MAAERRCGKCWAVKYSARDDWQHYFTENILAFQFNDEPILWKNKSISSVPKTNWNTIKIVCIEKKYSPYYERICENNNSVLFNYRGYNFYQNKQWLIYYIVYIESVLLFYTTFH